MFIHVVRWCIPPATIVGLYSPTDCLHVLRTCSPHVLHHCPVFSGSPGSFSRSASSGAEQTLPTWLGPPSLFSRKFQSWATLSGRNRSWSNNFLAPCLKMGYDRDFCSRLLSVSLQGNWWLRVEVGVLSSNQFIVQPWRWLSPEYLRPGPRLDPGFTPVIEIPDDTSMPMGNQDQCWEVQMEVS